MYTNKQDTNVKAVSGSNVNFMDARGDVEIDAANVSRKEPGTTSKEGYKDEVFGSYFMPHTTVVPNEGDGFFLPLTTNSAATNVDANLPTGDGVCVSTMAGRFTLKTSAPS